MKKNYNRVRKITAYFVFICFFMFPFFSLAFGVTDIGVKELKLEFSDYKGGDIVRGSFLAENNSKEAIDPDYEITLLSEGKVYNKKIYQIKEEIQPGASLSQTFEYELPMNIRSGAYILKIQLYSKNGVAFNWEEKGIRIEGNDFFVNITDSYILKDGERADAKIVPEFYPFEAPSIEVDIYNPNEIEMVLAAKLDFRREDSSLLSMEDLSADELKIFPRKNNKLRIEMSKLDQAGAYVAELEFFHEGKSISNIERFRWKNVAKEAEILSVGTEDGLYYPGRENKVIFEIEERLAIGETRDAKLTLEVRDRYTGVPQVWQKDIKLSSGRIKEEMALDAPAEGKILNINASIIVDGRIVDSFDGKLDVKIEKIVNEKKVDWRLMALAAILIIFIVVALFMWKNFDKISVIIENKLNKW